MAATCHHAFEAIGHRGCEGYAPGNSMAAINVAITLGIARVEVDVRHTADGQLVLFHDAMVGGRPFEGMAREALLAGTGKGEDEIPLLEDVLRACAGKTRVQLEVKTPGIARALHETITRAGYPLDDVHVSSFDAGELAMVRDEFGTSLSPVQLVYLFGGLPTRFVARRAARHGAGTISVKAKHVTTSKVAWLHDRGFRVIAFGVGDTQVGSREQIKRMYHQLLITGLDGFTCAFPDIARDMAAKRKAL